MNNTEISFYGYFYEPDYSKVCDFLDEIKNINDCILDVSFKSFCRGTSECSVIKTVSRDLLSNVKKLSKKQKQKQQELYRSFFIKLLLFSESLDKKKRNVLNEKIDCALKILKNPEFRLPKEIAINNPPENLIDNILEIKRVLAQKREEFEKEKETIIAQTKERLNHDGNVFERGKVKYRINLQAEAHSWRRIKFYLNFHLHKGLDSHDESLTCPKKWEILITSTKDNLIKETREAFNKIFFESFPVTSPPPPIELDPSASLKIIKKAKENGLKIAFREVNGKIVTYCYSKWNLAELIKNLLHSKKQEYLYIQFFSTLVSTKETLEPNEQAPFQREIEACQALLSDKANRLFVTSLNPLDEKTIKNLRKIKEFFSEQQKDFKISKEQLVQQLVQEKTKFPQDLISDPEINEALKKDLWFQRRDKSIKFNQIASTASWEKELRNSLIDIEKSLEERVVELAQEEDTIIAEALSDFSSRLEITKKKTLENIRTNIQEYNTQNDQMRHLRIKKLQSLEGKFRQLCLEQGRKLHLHIPNPYLNSSNIDSIMKEYIDKACYEAFGKDRGILLASLEHNPKEFKKSIVHFKSSFNQKLKTENVLKFLKMRSEISEGAWKEWEKNNAEFRLFPFSQSAHGSGEVLGNGICYAINYRWSTQIANRDPSKPITSDRDLNDLTIDPKNIPEKIPGKPDKPTGRDRKHQAAASVRMDPMRINPKEIRLPQAFVFEIPEELKKDGFTIESISTSGNDSIKALIEELVKDKKGWPNPNGIFGIRATGEEGGHALGMQIDDTNKIYRFWDVNTGFYQYKSLKEMKNAFVEYLKALYDNSFTKLSAFQYVKNSKRK